MKKIDLKGMAAKSSGEYVFGSEDTGSHACYMIYGTLKPGEKGRVVKPGKGHEEMVLAARGKLHITGEFDGILENPGISEALYVIAGGHAEHGHYH